VTNGHRAKGREGSKVINTIEIIYNFTDTGTDTLYLSQKCAFTGLNNMIAVSEGNAEKVQKDSETYSELLGVEVRRSGPIHDGMA
jgi:hypothetical protein